MNQAALRIVIGPTDQTGDIADGDTVRHATEAGFDVAEKLRRHNTCGLLSGIGGAIDTGILNTNAQDLRVVYVGR